MPEENDKGKEESPPLPPKNTPPDLTEEGAEVESFPEINPKDTYLYKVSLLKDVLSSLLKNPEGFSQDQKVVLHELIEILNHPDTELTVSAETVFQIIDSAAKEEEAQLKKLDHQISATELSGSLQRHFNLFSTEGSIGNTALDKLYIQIREQVSKIVKIDVFNAEEDKELPGLLGLRLLIIVIKNQVKLKRGGYPMAYSSDSEEEIERFVKNLGEVHPKVKESDRKDLVAEFELIKLILEKQLSDLKTGNPEVKQQFLNQDTKKMLKASNSVINYGREAMNEAEVPKENDWDLENFDAGLFLLDALHFGKIMNENLALRKADLENESKSAIWKHSLRAAGIGILPFPIVDMVGLSLVNRALVKELVEIYKVPYDDVKIKSTIGSLIGGIGSIVIGKRIVGALGKFVPGIGPLIGATSTSIASGATTYALGHVVKEQLSRGLSLSEINPDKAKDKMKQLYEDGMNLLKEQLIRN